MTLAVIAVIFGLALLARSADRFVEGLAYTARHFGIPPLLKGGSVLNGNQQLWASLKCQ